MNKVKYQAQIFSMALSIHQDEVLPLFKEQVSDKTGFFQRILHRTENFDSTFPDENPRKA